jgi:hypothetical protein
MKMEATCFSETPVDFQQVTGPYISEDRTHNLKLCLLLESEVLLLNLIFRQHVAEMSTICEPIVYKIWEPRRLRTLWAPTACYRDSFTFFYLIFRDTAGILTNFLPFYVTQLYTLLEPLRQ